MKKLLFILLFTMTFTACNTDVKSKELKVLDNSNSSELTFIIELNTKTTQELMFRHLLKNFLILLLKESHQLFTFISSLKTVKK